MTTTIYHGFTLEHPVSGVEYNFMMQAEETYDEGEYTDRYGNPGTPPCSDTRIIDWWEIDAEGKDKPDWVTDSMLEEVLSKITWEE